MQQYTGDGAGWGWNNASDRQGPAVAPVTSTAIQIHPEQQRINQYILAEMSKLKGDNKRLNDEILRLKMENLQLSGRINSALPAPHGLPIAFPDSAMIAPLGGPLAVKPPQELPYVLFDMRTPTPTVLSANVSFCNMLGYTMEEVLGRPWHHFIQDEYVERTIRELQRDKGAKQMQFGQVYKDRHGRAVPCQDLHTFNRDEKNRVVTDYVVVRPDGPPVPTMVPSMSGHGEPLTVIGAQARKARMIMSGAGGGGGGGGGAVQPDFGSASRGMSPLMMDVSDDKFEGAASPPPPLFGSSSDAWNLQPSVFAFDEDIPEVGERVPVRRLDNIP